MQKNHRNTLRIIGGQWRGRKIAFPLLADIRPTPNRVRETLFNWLAPVIANSSCLDLFAGSGLLGFEALSRGAGYVMMCDQSRLVIQHLHKTALQLEIHTCTHQKLAIQPYCVSAHALIKPAMKTQFDIVFLDPPFGRQYSHIACQWLKKNELIHPRSLVYLEMESQLPLCDALSLPFSIVKQSKASQVAYYLIHL